MVKSPIIFQIVGYQNSGKTTLVKKIIKQLLAKKYTATTIKHHGHGGKPDLHESKDSSQHISAGALAAIVEGDGRLLLQAEKPKWTIEEQISILKYFRPDFIIIEGYKQAHYPKIVILKEREDQKLLATLTNIQAVLCWKREHRDIENKYSEIPFFDIQSNEGEEWIIQYLIHMLNRT